MSLMRARGVTCVLVVACALGGACGGGSNNKPPAGGGSSGEAGASSEPGGGKSGSAGSKGDGGSKLDGGTSSEGGTKTDGGSNATGGGGAPDHGGAGAGSTDDSVELEVVAGADVHPISELIYGANMDGLACDDEKARFTFCRHRSPAWSTYNWENNASNAGRGDCHENNDALSAKTAPGAAVTDLIGKAALASAATVVTVPMFDYVAADANGGDAECSGNVTNSANYLTTRFKQNRALKGSALSLTPDTADAYVNQDEFVAFLKAGYPDAKLLFALDNQPELWWYEFEPLRGTKLTYDEQVAYSVDYAKMIKATWPGADVIGLVGYGYLAAKDLQESPDYALKGEFYGYFLEEMKKAGGDTRLLDYVDLHWFSELYPDGKRVIGEDATEASVVARVQAPRSLWDPNFVETSWITGANGGKPIELLPWLQGFIDDRYPGTELAISEWSFGGGKHISGAIAAADTLGIFGQRGVGLAGVVSFSSDEEPYLVGAFQAFRNYDGEGSAFGDTSVAAKSSNVALASIYASVDSENGSRLVLVAINRHSAALTAKLAIDHETEYGSLETYVISDGHPEPVPGDAVEAVSANHFELTLPAYSVSVLVPSE
jgi:hypothetical protein